MLLAAGLLSQRTRLHPALIAIGVVVVGQLFSFVGLFVAVPILSLMVIAAEEVWVKPVEESDARRRGPDIVISRELGDGDDGADQHEDDDEHLNDDPKAGKLHRPSATR